jgi:hypothetical protein
MAPGTAQIGTDRRTMGADPFSSSSVAGRPRGNNPITGVATARQYTGNGGWGGGGDYVSFPFYGPWGDYYPWYTPGFGWYVGYMGYNPWSYGATCWGWGIYGPWYNPYDYCWGSYYWPSTGYIGVDVGGGESPKSAKAPGDLRVLASPKTAKVYVDGALVGTVDEFDGLNSHLEIDSGHHVLGLKADGYEPYTQEVVVEGGRTQTIRIAMKKLK